METLLTVVIPAYNAEKYIKYTLDSLCDECTNKRLVLEKPEISDMEKGETEPDARYQENGQSCLEVLVVRRMVRQITTEKLQINMQKSNPYSPCDS